ncbi:PLD nuclease N-terminal domain-containing protein [Anaerobranca gottschalkii]|uniref:Phospholipase_D-nuclease N-terminal n=1 Tax=Anaerobranca gottschalkii DSM 13577 TaxID=1120990 RepID=A0A1H9YLL5_9FIRM|nr:PLD nuclease N-terminal domain-containing protein [Anaerobranca gottschalkii]SES69473.1 Phospholipase_D-nuclease N-terminal [Anaerobranca gottschalkii DSM 13577]
MGANILTLPFLLPLLFVEIALKLYCLYLLFKDGGEHLPKWAWAFIILFVSTLGPISFLIFGKRRY